MLEVIDDLTAAAGATPSLERARRLGPALARSPPRRRRPPGAVGRPAERKAAERVDEALHRLGALDAVEDAVTLEVFHRTLELELEQDLGRVGRFGDGVLVGSVEMGIGLDLDLVVILGLAEGSFPATVRDDSAPPRPRAGPHRRRAGPAGRPGRAPAPPAPRRPGRRGPAPAVRAPRRPAPQRGAGPSRWVLDLCTQLAGHGSRGGHPTWPPPASHGCGTWRPSTPACGTLDVPATAQEHRLRSLLATGGDLDRHRRRGHRPRRRGDQRPDAATAFTRFDGNLAGLPVPSPVDRITSPTRLERWADCPHRHLVEDLLRAAPVENPEDNLMITPLDKGSLVHAALEDFLLRVLERPIAERRPGQPWTAGDHAAAPGDRRRATATSTRPGAWWAAAIFWTRDRRRILADLDHTLVVDSAHRITHGTAPIVRRARLRVHRGVHRRRSRSRCPTAARCGCAVASTASTSGADGTIHVVDYKTGSYHQGYKDLLSGDPVGGGTKLQLPDLRPGRARRRPATPRRRRRGPSTGSSRARGGFARCGYDITDAVLERTVEVLDVIVRGVDDGVFPPHPPALSTFFRIACHVCDPDGLGTAELRKQWEPQARRPRPARVRRPRRAPRGGRPRPDRSGGRSTSRAPDPCAAPTRDRPRSRR